MSTVPMLAQMRARQKIAMIVTPTARPAGEGGVSTISSAAGKNASSSGLRLGANFPASCPPSRLTRLPNFMDACLNAMQRRVAPAGCYQLLVRSVLDQPAAVDGDDAIGAPHGGEAMRDDEDRAPAHDRLHVLLDDALALVIKRACRLVEDQDARLGDE